MTARKQGARMYTTAQLTTAKLPNIHDLYFHESPDSGEWKVECDLFGGSALQPLSAVRPAVETLPDDDILLLRLAGRSWISWKDACKLHSTGRQFLNYRVLNHCPDLDVLRLQPSDARSLSALTGGGWMPANRDSKLIFFDHVELAKVPLQPFKKRVKPARYVPLDGRRDSLDRLVGKRKHSSDEYSDEDSDQTSPGDSPVPAFDESFHVEPTSVLVHTSEFGQVQLALQEPLMGSVSPHAHADHVVVEGRTQEMRKRLRPRRHDELCLSDEEVAQPSEPLQAQDFVSRVRQQQRQRDEYQRWIRTMLREGSPKCADQGELSPLAVYSRMG